MFVASDACCCGQLIVASGGELLGAAMWILSVAAHHAIRRGLVVALE